jgi:hypothetical protein
MLPQPVMDLRAGRIGDTVTLDWTVPGRTTDRVALKGDQRVSVCRAVDAGPCQTQAVLLLEASRPAQYTDALPPELRDGQPRLLRYEVRLSNHRQQDAGASNPAFTAAGSAPPAIRSATAGATAQGIVVRWKAPVAEASAAPPPEARLLVRIERDRVVQAGEEQPAKREAQAGVPQPMRQVLETPEHPSGAKGQPWSPSNTLDVHAALNRSYRYTVRLVEQLTLGGHALEISSAPGQTGIVEAKDLFPPAVPENLAVVANASGGTIDLSWNADADADLAGYFVYRRAIEGAATPERVSGAKPLPTPNWSDTQAKRGVRYAYSVSAVDASGNQSALSTEAVEGLPE